MLFHLRMLLLLHLKNNSDMKQNDINELPKLDLENYENIFNVYQTEDKKYFYNLLTNLVFPKNLPTGLFKFYDTGYDDTWPLISYKQYNSPNLWWAILLANDIKNPTKPILPGTRLKIPVVEVVREMVAAIQK
jgi:hypothetical protein